MPRWSDIPIAWPDEAWRGYYDDGYLSKFARSGVTAVSDFVNYGFMESDAVAAERLKVPLVDSCHPAGRRPHIIMIHDESSFDIRQAKGIKVPPGYGSHFKSFDGKARKFMAESNGGSSWFTEYNVLAGLSSRSFGRFSYFVTRIAAGRVERGLPLALRRCGYSTMSLYPAHGAFMSARSFHTTTGIEHFFDARDLGAKERRARPLLLRQGGGPAVAGQRRRRRCSCSSISPPITFPGRSNSGPN